MSAVEKTVEEYTRLGDAASGRDGQAQGETGYYSRDDFTAAMEWLDGYVRKPANSGKWGHPEVESGNGLSKRNKREMG